MKIIFKIYEILSILIIYVLICFIFLCVNSLSECVNTLSECVTLFSDQFLNIYKLTILSSFQVGFRTYAIKKT